MLFPNELVKIPSLDLCSVTPHAASLGSVDSGVVIRDQVGVRAIIGHWPRCRDSPLLDVIVGLRIGDADQCSAWNEDHSRWWRIEDFGGKRDLYLFRVDYWFDEYLDSASRKAIGLRGWPDESECGHSDDFLDGVVVMPCLDENPVCFDLDFVHDPYVHDFQSVMETMQCSFELDLEAATLRCDHPESAPKVEKIHVGPR